MSHLLSYLNENHKTTEHVVDDFMNKFGVNVKNEDNLYLFKYGLITSNWTNKVTHECRGSILKFDGKWSFVSRPWDKFFNQHEGYCPIFEEEKFNEFIKDSVLLEKADGTCIQLWCDLDKKWKVSTLGTITPLNVMDEDITFSQLFWDTIGNVHFYELDPNFTYLFELCCDENRIVTKYTHNHVVYLGARDKRSGKYLQFTELQYDIDKGAFRKSNARLPHTIETANLHTLEDIKVLVEKESNSDRYGEYPEGFVIYDKKYFCPIAKMKNARYMSLHHVGGGDIKHSMNQVIDAVFLGHIDDIYDVLSDRLKNFADEVKNKALELTKNVVTTSEKMDEKDFSTRKSYAAFINDYADKKVRPFFFQHANSFMDKKKVDIIESFEKWLKDNYKKFEWKEE